MNFADKIVYFPIKELFFNDRLFYFGDNPKIPHYLRASKWIKILIEVNFSRLLAASGEG